MRIVALVIVVAAVVASGCAIEQRMPRPLTPDAIAELRGLVGKRAVRVEYGPPGQPSRLATLTHGSLRERGTAPPSLELVSPEIPQSISLEQVESLRWNDHLRGTLEGLGIGLLSGLVVGALAAPAGRSTCQAGSDSCVGFNLSAEIFWTSVIVGSAAGMVLGASVGQRYVVRF